MAHTDTVNSLIDQIKSNQIKSNQISRSVPILVPTPNRASSPSYPNQHSYQTV